MWSRVLLWIALAGCRLGFEPVPGDPVQDDDPCGDTSGLPAAAAWPLMHGCPTNAGRSRLAGPRSTTTTLGPSFADAGQTGAIVGAARHVFYAEYGPGTTSAFDAVTGSILWSVSTPGARPHLALAANDNLYVPSDHGVFYCLDAVAGTMRWQIQLQGSMAVPIVAAPGTVYVGTTNYGLFAIDTDARQQRWHFDVPGGGVVDTPAVGGGKVYVLDTLASHLFGLDAQTGTEIFDTAVTGGALGSPVLGSSGIYVATQTQGIAAFDPDTGSLSWQQPATTEATLQPALLGGGDVVSTTASGAAFVLDHNTGEALADFTLGGRISTPPVVDVDDAVYYATTVGLIAITPRDGNMISQATVSGKLALGDGSIIVLPPQGQFVVIAP